MLVESDYKGHRIEIHPELTDGRWDAVVRVRRVLTDEKPHVERVTCGKPDRELAERWGALWARRWVDVHGGSAW